MSAKKIVNQLHSPKPAKERVDKLGNSYYRLWFKSGNSTMLFAEKLTKEAIKCFISNTDKYLSQIHGKREGKWLITKQSTLKRIIRTEQQP